MCYTDLIVFTIATSSTDGFQRFMRSTKKFNLDVQVVILSNYTVCSSTTVPVLVFWMILLGSLDEINLIDVTLVIHDSVYEEFD